MILSQAEKPSSSPEVDFKSLRQALGLYPTGVAIITTKTPGGRRVGVTSNSFSSLSLTPPLVLWSLQRKSSSLEHFLQAETFLVKILSTEQIDLSRRFAVSSSDKFEGLDHEVSRTDCPAFAESLARIECRTRAKLDEGDHVLFIGIVEYICTRSGEPLIYAGGKYRRLAPLIALSDTKS